MVLDHRDGVIFVYTFSEKMLSLHFIIEQLAEICQFFQSGMVYFGVYSCGVVHHMGMHPCVCLPRVRF